MTINLAGAAIKDVRVAGAQAQKIMLGTGSAAVQVWSASPYPLTGTFNIVNVGAYQNREVFSHAVVEPGNFTATVTPTSGQATVFTWYVNGASKASGPVGTTSTCAFTGLSAGDTIRLTTMHVGTLNLSGTWSVVKN